MSEINCHLDIRSCSNGVAAVVIQLAQVYLQCSNDRGSDIERYTARRELFAKPANTTTDF